jgi:hypothetical protein
MSRSDLTQTMFSIISGLAKHAISSRERAAALMKEENGLKDEKTTKKSSVNTKHLLLAAMAQRRGNMSDNSDDWDD